ncbi:hypothetical protein CC78DRAFT_595776 [Lojkania enalia]|uniref:Uncharacterized protein n=1 Tax=Lojkania enalia TaxID=147567 RepID=A0A9P4N0Z7_9PLEO|nr:hypothetical protein CC78DRAFT_595776 [Didymosphaeria enalia]
MTRTCIIVIMYTALASDLVRKGADIGVCEWLWPRRISNAIPQAMGIFIITASPAWMLGLCRKRERDEHSRGRGGRFVGKRFSVVNLYLRRWTLRTKGIGEMASETSAPGHGDYERGYEAYNSHCASKFPLAQTWHDVIIRAVRSQRFFVIGVMGVIRVLMVQPDPVVGRFLGAWVL